MTEKGLKRNHKSYCTWHHRKWAVQRYSAHFPAAAAGVLQRELGLCGKLLQLDERNFHCWGYRRRAQRSITARSFAHTFEVPALFRSTSLYLLPCGATRAA